MTSEAAHQADRAAAQPRPASASGRLVVLDALRGIAALCVVLHHETSYHKAAEIVPCGYLAVDFFFLLSGFVLTSVFESRLAQGTPPLRLLAERVARLGPIMAIGIGIGAAAFASHAGTADAIMMMAMALMLIPHLAGTGAIYPVNGPMWSLAFELVANAAHVFVLNRLRDWQLGVIVAGFGVGLVYATFTVGRMAFGDMTDNWWFGFCRIGFSYPLGVLLGRWHRTARRTWHVSWTIPVALLPAILVFAPLVPRVIGDLVIAMLIMPAVLWVSAGTRVPDRAVPAMRWLGGISYPVYALHVPLFAFTVELAARAGWQDSTAFRIAVVLAILAVSARLAASPVAKGIRLAETPHRSHPQSPAIPGPANG